MYSDVSMLMKNRFQHLEKYSNGGCGVNDNSDFAQMIGNYGLVEIIKIYPKGNMNVWIRLCSNVFSDLKNKIK